MNPTTSETATVVLVHGAWADSTGFDGTIRALRGQGLNVVAAANPLRSLAGDAAYVGALLRTIDGPTVLVGHSYGGAVISNAAVGQNQVTALVFINGWVPDEGESLQGLAEKFAGSLVPGALRPVPITNPDGSEGVDLYIDRSAFASVFAADVDPGAAEVMAAAQRPITAQAFAEPSGPPAWRTLPSWYLLGTADKAIPPDTQRFMAERAGAHIETVAASHASMVSQPEAVTRLVLSAVEATTRVAAATA